MKKHRFIFLYVTTKNAHAFSTVFTLHTATVILSAAYPLKEEDGGEFLN